MVIAHTFLWNRNDPSHRMVRELNLIAQSIAPAMATQSRIHKTTEHDKEILRYIRELSFDCRRNALYHSTRQYWLEGCHRWMMFIVIIFGTGTVSALLGGMRKELAALISVVPTLAGALDLVFAFSDRANHHHTLYARYCELLGEIEAKYDASHEDLSGWRVRLHILYADEPPPFRALDAWCHNAVCLAEGSAASGKLDIPWYHLVLKNVFPFSGSEYKFRKA